MPQSTIALLALAASLLVSVNRQRQNVDEQFRMIGDEVEMMMLNVVTDHLEEVGAMAFDEATRGNDTAESESDLTAASDFGGAEAGSENDVDDFHNSVRTITRTVGSETLTFRVTTQVHYMHETASPPMALTSGVSRIKRITSAVESLTYPLPSAVTLQQTVACGSGCTW